MKSDPTSITSVHSKTLSPSRRPPRQLLVINQSLSLTTQILISPPYGTTATKAIILDSSSTAKDYFLIDHLLALTSRYYSLRRTFILDSSSTAKDYFLINHSDTPAKYYSLICKEQRPSRRLRFDPSDRRLPRIQPETVIPATTVTKAITSDPSSSIISRQILLPHPQGATAIKAVRV